MEKKVLFTGKFDLSILVRTMLEAEFAFLIESPKAEIRVAHHKGTWSVIKIKDERVADGFLFDDQLVVSECGNPLTKGFLEAQVKIHEKDEWDKFSSRIIPARCISNLLQLWGAGFDEATKIEIVQERRNSTLSDDGEFQLSPDTKG